jgi:hypothetical protein
MRALRDIHFQDTRMLKAAHSAAESPLVFSSRRYRRIDSDVASGSDAADCNHDANEGFAGAMDVKEFDGEPHRVADQPQLSYRMQCLQRSVVSAFGHSRFAIAARESGLENGAATGALLKAASTTLTTRTRPQPGIPSARCLPSRYQAYCKNWA